MNSRLLASGVFGSEEFAGGLSRAIRFVLFSVVTVVVVSACGGDASDKPVDEPDELGETTVAATPQEAEADTSDDTVETETVIPEGPIMVAEHLAACDLITEEEAEQVLGMSLQTVVGAPRTRCGYLHFDDAEGGSLTANGGVIISVFGGVKPHEVNLGDGLSVRQIKGIADVVLVGSVREGTPPGAVQFPGNPAHAIGLQGNAAVSVLIIAAPGEDAGAMVVELLQIAFDRLPETVGWVVTESGELVSACDLLSSDEAEALVGGEFGLVAEGDNRCTFSGERPAPGVDRPNVSINIEPAIHDYYLTEVAELEHMVRDFEELEGIGEAAFIFFEPPRGDGSQVVFFDNGILATIYVAPPETEDPDESAITAAGIVADRLEELTSSE